MVLLRTGTEPATAVIAERGAVTVRIGGPRTGKSTSLACHIADAPGPVVATSIGRGLVTMTTAARARRGRVLVFDPRAAGASPVESTPGSRAASVVRWSPLAGCTDLSTARRRATDLLAPPLTDGQEHRWHPHSRDLLTALLYGAAYTSDPDTGDARTVTLLTLPGRVRREHHGAVLQALTASPDPDAASLAERVQKIFATSELTLRSITTPIVKALRWAYHDDLAAVGHAALDDPAFLDVPSLVAGTDTLHLIASSDTTEGDPCRPLLGALVADIVHHATTHAAPPAGEVQASDVPAGAPLTVVLDDAPQVCGPIPVHTWTTSRAVRRGVTLHVAAQSLAQLRQTYGDDPTEALLAGADHLLIFGGLTSSGDLARISVLTRAARQTRIHPDGPSRVPTQPTDIAALPPGTALLLRPHRRALLGRPPLIHHRADTPARALERRNPS